MFQFRLREVFIATSIAAVVLACVAPFVRRMDAPGQRAFGLVWLSAAVTFTAVVTMYFAMRRVAEYRAGPLLYFGQLPIRQSKRLRIYWRVFQIFWWVMVLFVIGLLVSQSLLAAEITTSTTLRKPRWSMLMGFTGGLQLSTAAMFLWFGRAGFEIRQLGLVSLFVFMPWKSLDYYSWQETPDLQLEFKLKYGFGNWTVGVPPSRRAKLEEILQQRLRNANDEVAPQ